MDMINSNVARRLLFQKNMLGKDVNAQNVKQLIYEIFLLGSFFENKRRLTNGKN